MKKQNISLLFNVIFLPILIFAPQNSKSSTLTTTSYFRDFPIIQLKADRLAYDFDSKSVAAEDNVVIFAGDIMISANKATLYTSDWTLVVMGNVVISGNDRKLEADFFQLDFVKRQIYKVSLDAAVIFEIYTYPHLKAESLTGLIKEKRLMLFSEIELKTAYLQVNSLIVHPNLKASADKPVFIVDASPLLYLPKIVFILDDKLLKKGLLLHSLSYSSIVSSALEYRYYVSEHIQGSVWGYGEYRLNQDRYDQRYLVKIKALGTLFQSQMFTLNHDMTYDTEDAYRFVVRPNFFWQENQLKLELGTHRFNRGNKILWTQLLHNYTMGRFSTNVDFLYETNQTISSRISARYEFDETLFLNLKTGYFSKNPDKETRRKEHAEQEMNIEWSFTGVRINPGLFFRKYLFENRSTIKPFISLFTPKYSLGKTPFIAESFWEIEYFSDKSLYPIHTYNVMGHLDLILEKINISEKLSFGYHLSPGINISKNAQKLFINDVILFLTFLEEDSFQIRTEYCFHSRWNMNSPGWTEGISDSSIKVTLNKLLSKHLKIQTICEFDTRQFECLSNEVDLDFNINDLRLGMEIYYDFKMKTMKELNISISKQYRFLDLRLAYYHERNDLRFEVTSLVF